MTYGGAVPTPPPTRRYLTQPDDPDRVPSEARRPIWESGGQAHIALEVRQWGGCLGALLFSVSDAEPDVLKCRLFTRDEIAFGRL